MRLRVVLAKLSLPCALLASVVFSASGGEPPAPEAIAPPEARFKWYGWIESGITFNPDDPSDRQNFGHLFTDRANELLLNQAVLTAERTLAPSGDNFDWGFKAQVL